MKIFSVNGGETKTLPSFESPIAGLYIVGEYQPANRITVTLNHRGEQKTILNGQRISNLVSMKMLQDIPAKGRLEIPLTVDGSLFLDDETYLSITYEGSTNTDIDVYAVKKLGIAQAVLTYKAIHFNQDTEKDLDLSGVFAMDLSRVTSCELTDNDGNVYKLTSIHEVRSFFQAEKGVTMLAASDTVDKLGKAPLQKGEMPTSGTAYEEERIFALLEGMFSRGSFIFSETGIKNLCFVNQF